MTANNPLQFPIDLTGESARNLIRNEEREFKSYAERIFVPSGGVFYTDSLVIFDKDSGRRLRPLVDYKCLHLHQDASLDSGKQCCCIIVVENQTISRVKYDYQVVGGHYSDTISNFKDLLEGVDFTSLTKISWGTQIYGKPETYPAATHKHPGSQFANWERTLVALNNIYHALTKKDIAAWQSVYEYINSQLTNTVGTVRDALTNDYYTRQQVDNKITAFTQSQSIVVEDTLTAYYTKPQVEQLISDIEGKILGKSEQVISQVSSQTASTAGQINNVAGTVTSLGERLDNLNQSITGISGKVDTANQNIATLTENNENINNRVNAVESKTRISREAGNLITTRPDGMYATFGLDDMMNLTKRHTRLQQFKPGDIYTTTRTIESEQQLIDDIGYGQWERISENTVNAVIRKPMSVPKPNQEAPPEALYAGGDWSNINTIFGGITPTANVASLNRQSVIPRPLSLPIYPEKGADRWRRVISLKDPACVGGGIITIKSKQTVVESIGDLSVISSLSRENPPLYIYHDSNNQYAHDVTSSPAMNSNHPAVIVIALNTYMGQQIKMSLLENKTVLDNRVNFFTILRMTTVLDAPSISRSSENSLFYYVDDKLDVPNIGGPNTSKLPPKLLFHYNVITPLIVSKHEAPMVEAYGIYGKYVATQRLDYPELMDTMESGIPIRVYPKPNSGSIHKVFEHQITLPSIVNATVAVAAYRR